MTTLGWMMVVGLAGCAEGLEPPQPTAMVEITDNLTFRFGPDPRIFCGTVAGQGGVDIDCDAGQAAPTTFPQVTVALEPFAIDEHEVTNFQYEYCVAKGACTEPAFGNSQTRDFYYGEARFRDFPVVNVTWDQANDYCAFVGGRLPSEIEWERAARGADNSLLIPSSVVAVDAPEDCLNQFPIIGCGANGDTQRVKGTANDVVTHTAGQVFDLTGNVAEWTSSNWVSLDLTCAATDPCGEPVTTPPTPETCETCTFEEPENGTCHEQCNVYICSKYNDDVTLTPDELLPTAAADRAIRGGSSITPRNQLCSLLSTNRSQKGDLVNLQPFLGFRCARSL